MEPQKKDVTMLDIDGFLASTEFLTQLAAFIAALFGGLIQALLGTALGG